MAAMMEATREATAVADNRFLGANGRRFCAPHQLHL
jgi:hypothetical protein